MPEKLNGPKNNCSQQNTMKEPSFTSLHKDIKREVIETTDDPSMPNDVLKILEDDFASPDYKVQVSHLGLIEYAPAERRAVLDKKVVDLIHKGSGSDVLEERELASLVLRQAPKGIRDELAKPRFVVTGPQTIQYKDLKREVIETSGTTDNRGVPEKVFHTGPAGKKGRELAYTNKFADFIKKHPGFLTKTKKAVDTLFNLPIDSPAPIQEVDDVKIEYVGWHGREKRKYYKITTEDGCEFFLKVSSSGSSFGEEGAESLLTMRKAKEALRDFSGFPVNVIDYQIGYKDADRTYFLASFDDRMRTTIADDVDGLDKKIKKISQSNPQNQDIQKLLESAKIRAFLKKLYYIASCSDSFHKSFHEKRLAKIVPWLDNLNAQIDRMRQKNLNGNIPELIQLIQTKDELWTKYYQVLSYLNSKSLANDFHEGNMSYDKSKNEALIFDLREGNYMDPDDFGLDPDLQKILNSLDE